MPAPRVGLVGTSTWATQVHGASLQAHTEAELVCVWGRDPAKAAQTAAELGVVAASSYADLLEQVDVIDFSVPPEVQARLAVQAAEAGKHLFLEKPLALTADDAASVSDAVTAAGVASVVFLTRLWEPTTAAWFADLSSRGGWDSGRVTMVAALSEDFLDRSPWRAEHGALWDVGPHALSALERVLGRITDVQVSRGRRDLVQLLLRHDGGAVSTAELCLTAAPAAAHSEFAFWGADGRSPALPELGLPEVLAAHTAAMSALSAQVTSGERVTDRDADYGLHLSALLFDAAARAR